MGTCYQCKSEINEQAKVCPECGFNPVKVGRTSRTALRWLGYLCTFTIIGSVIGIPLLISAHIQDKQAKKRKPTTYNPA
jgi:RNA polymerase subunit RPABC4/transcription elongation factor Spt4